MAKDFDYVFDLGKFSGTQSDLDGVVKECTAARPPPLTPDDFAHALTSKSFTSKKADERRTGIGGGTRTKQVRSLVIYIHGARKKKRRVAP